MSCIRVPDFTVLSEKRLLLCQVGFASPHILQYFAEDTFWPSEMAFPIPLPFLVRNRAEGKMICPELEQSQAKMNSKSFVRWHSSSVQAIR